MLGEGMNLLGYLVPVIEPAARDLEGRMDLDLYLRGHGHDRPALIDSLVGQGTIRLDPLRLRRSSLLGELSQALPVPGDLRIGAVHGEFGIAKGRVLTDGMTLEAGATPIVLSGCTSFDGQIDYRVRCDAIREKLSPLLAELPVELDDVAELRIQGTPGKLRTTVGGLALRDASGRRVSDREAVREIGRRLRDRLFR
jgi:hypothetical protein